MNTAITFIGGVIIGALVVLLVAAVRERRLLRRHEAALQMHRDLFTGLLTRYIELRASAAGLLKKHETEDPVDWWRKEPQ
jgi:hypothetical protein